MASGIFAVLDDIAALMDDVAVASKVAAQKTAGILGDDLAVNAEKATGFLSSREIPVLWKITKGSLLNKVIIIPIILALNYFLPAVISIILLIGGFYLAYEGVEKVIHYFKHFKDKNHAEDLASEKIEQKSNEELLKEENTKVKSAITTDFILSIEIVIMALATTLNEPFHIQAITVVIISLVATVGVYGIVALIVRMDDAGYKIIRKTDGEGFWRSFGRTLVRSLPVVIKALSIIGTIALLLVSGGIFAHNVDFLHHILPNIPSTLKELLLGIAGGLIAFVVISIIQKFLPKKEVTH